MLNKINHVKYTKTYAPRQLVLPLDYGISLEQDWLVCIVDALLERLDYSALQHLGSLTLAIKEKRCEASKMAYFFVNFSIFFLSNV